MKLVFFSVGRSDYGIMRNIIKTVENDKIIRSSLILTGSHLSEKFGETINEIKLDKIKNIHKINLNYKSNNKDLNNSHSAFLIKKTDKILKKIKPDYVIVLGDRYEMLAMSISAFNNDIKIIHFCGGSNTLGAKDDQYRKCISILASYHFVETILHKKELINNGINQESIFISGAPALENLNNIKYLSKKNLFKSLKINEDLNKNIIVATFHPETKISIKKNIYNFKVLLKFLNQLKNEIVILTYPNADYGYEKIIDLISKIKPKNFYIFKSLGIKNYYNILKFGNCLIGNSSSGIIESKSFNIPTINLGNRQEGRFHNNNVINCKFKLEDIKKNYKFSQSKKFLKLCNLNKNIYKLVLSSVKVLKLIKNNFK
jgi:GDP/UDP-N,N'-diacetylbacillosamine 2-epimerase (hydrolysing)